MPQCLGLRQHPTGAQSPAEEGPVKSLVPEDSADVNTGPNLAEASSAEAEVL